MSKYRFTLGQNYTWNCGKRPRGFQDGEVRKFSDSRGNHWLTIDWKGNITIQKNYSWDGCTPKLFKIGKYWVGTPDGRISKRTGKPQAYYASLIHDVLYQFMKSSKMPFTRKEMDDFFKVILKRDGFKFSGLYYTAVRLFGGISQWF